jgi:hypothetical protein
MGDALVDPSARRFHAGGQQFELPVSRRQRQGPHDRFARGVELAKTQMRQAEIGPPCRFISRELGRLREILPGVVEQTDLEGCQPSIEHTRDLRVGSRALGRKGPALCEEEKYESRDHRQCGDDRDRSWREADGSEQCVCFGRLLFRPLVRSADTRRPDEQLAAVRERDVTPLAARAVLGLEALDDDLGAGGSEVLFHPRRSSAFGAPPSTIHFSTVPSAFFTSM